MATVLHHVVAPHTTWSPTIVTVTRQMNPAQAKELLLLHSFCLSNADDPKMSSGFLGSLRPYRGSLTEENFHEVMAALLVVAPLLERPKVDREIVRSLWSICHLARSWGVSPLGMLQSNSLITPEDARRLEAWVDQISYTTMAILDGAGEDIAFNEYRQQWRR